MCFYSRSLLVCYSISIFLRMHERGCLVKFHSELSHKSLESYTPCPNFHTLTQKSESILTICSPAFVIRFHRPRLPSTRPLRTQLRNKTYPNGSYFCLQRIS
ncbi:hypothetical protein I7I48_03562 [Histoplasma ohiense]|nr:hypothetical protein I7I48_03562 [Histoplasma ohiense (nom. inval.)]